MSDSIPDQLREQAFEYVSGLLSPTEAKEFEEQLSGDHLLKKLVKEYQSTLNLSHDVFDFIPSDEELQSQRLQLRGRIDQINSQDNHVFRWRIISSKIKHFLTSPQPAWAVISYMVIAVILSKMIPMGESKNHSINVAELLQSHELKKVKLVNSFQGDDRIHFALETGDDMDISGQLNDENIQQLLFYLLLNDKNPGKRLKAIRLLMDSAPQTEAQSVLVSALLTDSNPGVRLRSIEILRNYEPSELILEACIKVLLEDDNEAVRQYALEILSENPIEKALPVLQIVSVMDENEFIRAQATLTLHSFKESIEPDLLEVK